MHIKATKAAKIRGWQIERTKKLQSIFESVERRASKGTPVRGAIRAAARRWKGRAFRDGRPVRFSADRLTALFYQWKRLGRTAEALRLGFQPRRTRLASKVIARFVRRCRAPGVYSMAHAYRTGKFKRVSIHQVRRSLSPSERLLIRQFHHIRIKTDAVAGQIDALFSQSPSK